jgi:transposase
LVPHLTVDELGERYKTAARAGDARRYHAVWLIAQGHTAKAAAALIGLSDKWVRTLVQRYNAAGPSGLRDARADNPGAAPLLGPAHQQALFQALQTPPPEGGVWTGPKVATWIMRQTGITTHPQRGWAYMRRLGFSVQSPRPRHVQAATPVQQTSWKKSSRSASMLQQPWRVREA